jgi:hypothetical protein
VESQYHLRASIEYCGILSNTGTLNVPEWEVSVKGDFRPLTNVETFQRVQETMSGRRVAITPRQRNNPDFPLRNFVRCGVCHKPLTASWSKGKMGVKYAYYRCQNRKCPEPVNTRRESVEDAFIEFVREQQPDSGYIRLFHKVVLDVWDSKQADSSCLAGKLQREIDQTKQRKERSPCIGWRPCRRGVRRSSTREMSRVQTS